jgi:hypothetical protein
VTDIIEKGDQNNGKLPRSATFTINREWISLEDLAMRMDQIQNPGLSTVAETEPAEPEEKKGSCLCLCFSGLFRKKEATDKASKYATNGRNGYRKQNMLEVARTQGQGSKSRSKEEEMENLRNLADTFKQKANIFYDILKDGESLSSQALVKYFEQERGVLVLDTDCAHGFMIVNICMRVEQLERLRKDYANGKLAKDIEGYVVTDNVLSQVGARGMKLQTVIDQEEFDIAEQELR